MVLSRPMGREVSAVFAVNVVFTQISLWKRHNSLRRLGQKAYQVLATHRIAEAGGDRRTGGYKGLCSSRSWRKQRVCQRDDGVLIGA